MCRSDVFFFCDPMVSDYSDYLKIIRKPWTGSKIQDKPTLD